MYQLPGCQSACECRTGCDSLHSIAVWLRFQLPPLHLANTDCVMLEMHEQLGVKGKAATSIIEDLNVVGAPCWLRCGVPVLVR